MPKDNDENSIWFEVLQRLTKIETNTEGLNEISGIARTALAKSEENSKDIEEIKENQKWAWRTCFNWLTPSVYATFEHRKGEQ